MATGQPGPVAMDSIASDSIASDSIAPPCCVSLDLEVGRDRGRIRALGAVRPDDGRRLVHEGRGLAAALAGLDDLADGASFVLGHNLIAFDLPHLRAAKPDLRLLALPVVDTLRLSPLAFPRNPYHHLVKHYQDGGLRRGRVNDPELDARLALELFGDERATLAQAPPDLLAAWHLLCTPEPTGVDRALDGIFVALRQAGRPSRGRDRGGGRTTAGEHRLHDPGSAASRRTRPSSAGRWPTPWRGSPWRAAIRCCRRGCATSSRKPAGSCAASGTPPAPIPPATGAANATTRAGN